MPRVPHLSEAQQAQPPQSIQPPLSFTEDLFLPHRLLSSILLRFGVPLPLASQPAEQLSSAKLSFRTPPPFFAALLCLISQLYTLIMGDPRTSSSYSIVPQIRYNTVAGINGPLVILENVRTYDLPYPHKIYSEFWARRRHSGFCLVAGADVFAARSNSPSSTRSSLSPSLMALNALVRFWRLAVRTKLLLPRC
jgi:hypothetical protein